MLVLGGTGSVETRERHCGISCYLVSQVYGGTGCYLVVLEPDRAVMVASVIYLQKIYSLHGEGEK